MAILAILLSKRAASFWQRGQKRKKAVVAKVVGRVEACYDVEEVEYGKVYRWQPETLVVECGQETAITPSEDTCEECGAEHAGLVREDLSNRQSQNDEDVHPWRYLGDDGASPY
jgi:hypothetical protein